MKLKSDKPFSDFASNFRYSEVYKDPPTQHESRGCLEKFTFHHGCFCAFSACTAQLFIGASHDADDCLFIIETRASHSHKLAPCLPHDKQGCATCRCTGPGGVPADSPIIIPAPFEVVLVGPYTRSLVTSTLSRLSFSVVILEPSFLELSGASCSS